MQFRTFSAWIPCPKKEEGRKTALSYEAVAVSIIRSVTQTLSTFEKSRTTDNSSTGVET